MCASFDFDLFIIFYICNRNKTFTPHDLYVLFRHWLVDSSVPWISKCSHYKVWGDITYPFPNFNGSVTLMHSYFARFQCVNERVRWLPRGYIAENATREVACYIHHKTEQMWLLVQISVLSEDINYQDDSVLWFFNWTAPFRAHCICCDFMKSLCNIYLELAWETGYKFNICTWVRAKNSLLWRYCPS